MTKSTVPKSTRNRQTDSNQPKLPRDIIIDEFFQIQRVAHALKVVRDGIRNAETADELETWQDITDMMLEFHIQNLNDVMESLADSFEGIEYEPVVQSRGSLLSAGRNNYPAEETPDSMTTASCRKGGAHVAI